ncbi:NADH-quinone oxidoreductase subunit J [Orrella sp. JC864]|uniref:NADH-quinone oxidoreductase subunit J n=1 Tax=Orrella sp. JC864 TaxID=3120298 RepID=UPI003009D4EC
MFTTILFYVLAAVLVFAAFRVITARNPVTAVMHLILAFFNAAMIWMLLGAEFLALLLVLVYVGAVMVLFLFVVMMLDIRIDTLSRGLKTYLPLGLAIGLIMVVEMAFVLGTTWAQAGPQAVQADDYNNARTLGEVMYSQYVFGIEVGAVLLLVGMVAAIALTLRRRRDVRYNNPSEAVRVKASERFRMVKMAPQVEKPAEPTPHEQGPDAVVEQAAPKPAPAAPAQGEKK